MEHQELITQLHILEEWSCQLCPLENFKRQYYFQLLKFLKNDYYALFKEL